MWVRLYILLLQSCLNTKYSLGPDYLPTCCGPAVNGLGAWVIRSGNFNWTGLYIQMWSSCVAKEAVCESAIILQNDKRDETNEEKHKKHHKHHGKRDEENNCKSWFNLFTAHMCVEILRRLRGLNFRRLSAVDFSLELEECEWLPCIQNIHRRSWRD